ncbi:MAG TPA: ABC transporter ATP-binding protein [Patescibacteria group bacterium]|nr:ABC transporter ATP-binding protein [Patescibacteria group bacterium]
MNSSQPQLTTIGVLKRSLHFIKPFKGLLFLQITLNSLFAVISVFTIAIVQLIAQVLSAGQPLPAETPKNLSQLDSLKENFFNSVKSLVEAPTQQGILVKLSFLIIGLFVFKNIVKYANSLTSLKLEEGIIKNIRDQVFQKLTSLSVDYFSRSKSGHLMSVINNDVGVVNGTTVSSFSTFLREGIQVALYLLLLISLSPRLTAMAFSTSILSLLVIRMATKYLKRYAGRMQEAMADYTSALQETLNGIRIVKAYNAEGSVVTRFKNQTAHYIASSLKHQKVTSLIPAINEIFAISALAVVFYIGGMEVAEGTMRGDELWAFLFALFTIMAPIATVVNTAAGLQRGVVASERVFAVLDEEPLVKSGRTILKDFNDAIEVRNVIFSYGEKPVLKDASFIVEKSKKVALVGASGSGKSTMLDLLIRFYDPQSGDIYADGINIRDLTVDSYRSLFGIVSQEATLFNDTVANNIRFGKPEIPLEDIIRAAKIANAHEFISAMPLGYDTPIGDRGVLLSGGQRQRLAIARALARDPQILIFDEATSALDSESEKIVQSAIDEVLKNRTAILVAHRLSTIINSDEILVFDGGEIVERGTHHELLLQDGVYRRLYDIQYAQQRKVLAEEELKE